MNQASVFKEVNYFKHNISDIQDKNGKHSSLIDYT